MNKHVALPRSKDSHIDYKHIVLTNPLMARGERFDDCWDIKDQLRYVYCRMAKKICNGPYKTWWTGLKAAENNNTRRRDCLYMGYESLEMYDRHSVGYAEEISATWRREQYEWWIKKFNCYSVKDLVRLIRLSPELEYSCMGRLRHGALLEAGSVRELELNQHVIKKLCAALSNKEEGARLFVMNTDRNQHPCNKYTAMSEAADLKKNTKAANDSTFRPKSTKRL